MNKRIGILIFFLFMTLTFSIQYPFFSIHEGLTGNSSKAKMLSVEDISGINQTLSNYYSVTETNCKTTIDAIQKLNIKSINEAIQKGVDLSYCTVVDNISSSYPTNQKVNDLINTCYGKKYTEVLNILTEIQNGSVYASNSEFATYINNLSSTPSISGSKETVKTIQKYLGMSDMINQSQDAAAAGIAAAAGTPASSTTPISKV
jgi:hypothetical protein